MSGYKFSTQAIKNSFIALLGSIEELRIIDFSQKAIDSLEILIKGPLFSIYRDGTYKILIKCPKDFTYQPPEISFITWIYNPNIHPKLGIIYADILRENWKPIYKIVGTLIALLSLISEPEPLDDKKYPAEIRKIGNYFNNNREKYFKRARKWVQKYAKKIDIEGN